MKNYFFFLFLLVIQQTAWSQNYPNIDYSIQFEKTDFTEIDQLIKDGQPNKAIGKLLTKQIVANSSQNLREIVECYNRLKTTFNQSGREPEDLQLLFLEQHRIFANTVGPARNVSAKYMSEWVQNYRIRNAFTFDDESLQWPVKGRFIRLENRDYSVLEAYYLDEILTNEEDLMRVSALEVFDTAMVQYLPTLFDVFAFYKLEAGKYSADKGCYLQSTEVFFGLDLKDDDELLAKLETLNKKHDRWDAYAFWVETRLSRCDVGENEKELEESLARFQREMLRYPASNRFALRRAQYFASKASNYSWQAKNDFDNGFVKALEIVNAALEKHPKSDFTEQLIDLKKRIEETSLSFNLRNLTQPNARVLMTVDYRNLTTAHLAIYKVLKRFSEKSKENNPMKKMELKLIDSKDLDLDNDNKMLAHSKDFLISQMDETGEFLVIITPTKEDLKKAMQAEKWDGDMKVDLQVFSLTNLVLRSKQTDENVEILVNDVRTGMPIVGASVKVKSRYPRNNENTLAEGKTNAKGYFAFSGIQNFTFTVFQGGDSVSSEGYFYRRNNEEATSHQIYTDRSIYRPGQTIYFKTLSYDQEKGNGTFWKGKEIEVQFKDGNSEEIYKVKLTTNEFGSATGSFVLPKSGFPLGSIYMYVNGAWEKSVLVEEYKRPTFEVNFEKPKGRVVLGAPFTMEGKVMAYAGYPLANAEVEINISENCYFPRWCFVMDEWRNYDTTIQVTTDENGVFSFEYTSDKPKDAYGIYYNFEAFVVDISGEIQTANHSLYLGKTAYSIESNVENKYRKDKEIAFSAEVYNSQYDKQSNVVVSYEVEIMDASNWYLHTENKAEFTDFSRREFEKHFPRTQYYADQETKYSAEQKGTFRSGESVKLNELKPGNYRVNMSSIDEIGDTTTTSSNFTVWNPESKRKQHLSPFWVEATNATPQLGEEMSLYVGSSFRKTQLLVAIYDQRGLVSMEYMKLKRRKKLDFTFTEKYKEDVSVYLSSILDGDVLSEAIYFTPVDSSKILKMKLKSIQEPLLPGTKQSWEIELSQQGGITNDAELLASMYDASLDAFTDHNWQTNLLQSISIDPNWRNNYSNSRKETYQVWRAPSFYLGNSRVRLQSRYAGEVSEEIMEFSDGPSTTVGSGAYKMDKSLEINRDMLNASLPMDILMDEKDVSDVEPPKSIRENFNETAFFEPQIHVTADGKYNWSFTLPDAMTRWKLMTFAHTTDFKTVYQEHTFEARKELLLETFEPRFWKKGDETFWVGKVVNLSDKEQTVEVTLKIQNLIDESDVSALFGDFQKQTIVLKPNESKAVEWPITISENSPTMVRFEVEASAEKFSDILRKTIPVLENKERITLAQNFTISKKGTHALQIDDIKNVSNEADVKNYCVSVQTQPLWTTMLSLTHLLEPINVLNETYFGQFYAASLAKKILDENPTMKQAMKAWSMQSDDALTSMLEQNEELKALILAETPWVLEAKNDSENLRRLSQLLDENHLNQVIRDSWNKVKDLQHENGAWSWVGQDRPNWYITQYFAKGLSQLVNAGVQIDTTVLSKSISALDGEYTRRYNELTDKEKNKEYGLGTMEVEWLYVRAVLQKEETEVSKYYADLLPKKWLNFSLSTQAMIGVWAILNEQSSFAKKILASFDDKARRNKTLGTYWNNNQNGYGWYENKIETQAVMIDVYQRISDKEETVKEMQKWLLQQKRTQLWDSPKSSAMACFALRDFKSNSVSSPATLRFENESIVLDESTNKGSTSFKKSPEIQNLNSAKIGAELITESDDLIFASAQVVYTDKSGNIAKTTGDFRVERIYYRLEKGEEIQITDSTQMEVGNIIRVKIKLVSDRDLDFVYIEDPKASGWEPLVALSGYRYFDTYYYLSNRDSKTEFFVENLRKGTHLFTYDVKVTAKGKLQVGPLKASCYYAPSFVANSKGEVFTIE